MSASYETLAIEHPSPEIAVVRLNRPEVSNALNTQMGLDLLDVWTRLTAEPGEVRCAILTGAGDKAFCGGGDLKQRNGMSVAAWKHQHEIFERSYWALHDCPVPVIAAVNGHAFAGGLEMALGCDFIYAVRTARFALTEVTIGIMPGGTGTVTLPRALGERRAKEIILTGKPFSAEEAHQWGMVNRLVEPGGALEAALETARVIAGNAPLSVRQAKKSIHFGLQMDVRSAFRFEIEAYNRLVDTEDRIEGVRAFNEKRKPAFKGR